MDHKFSDLSIGCARRSSKRFDENHRVKFSVMNFLFLENKANGWLLWLFFSSLKGMLKGREEDRVCLHRVVVIQTGHHPREYGFNRRNFIRGYVYVPCFTRGVPRHKFARWILQGWRSRPGTKKGRPWVPRRSDRLGYLRDSISLECLCGSSASLGPLCLVIDNNNHCAF